MCPTLPKRAISILFDVVGDERSLISHLRLEDTLCPRFVSHTPTIIMLNWMEAEAAHTDADKDSVRCEDNVDDYTQGTDLNSFARAASVVVYAKRWRKRAESLDEVSPMSLLETRAAHPLSCLLCTQVSLALPYAVLPAAARGGLGRSIHPAAATKG